MSIENDAHDFLRARGDSVERDLADIVCPLIPHYPMLWATFVGNQDGRAQAYPLRFSSDVTEEKRQEVHAGFEALCAAHYTLFNHVFSLQGKVASAREWERKPRSGLTHARYLEAVEEFYFHYGVVLTQFERTWAVVVDLDPDVRGLRGTIRDKLRSRVKEGSRNARLLAVVYAVLEPRHSVEHYARSAIIIGTDGKYYTKLPRVKGEPWSTYMQRPGRAVPMTALLEKDLRRLLGFVNAWYPLLISELQAFLGQCGASASAADVFDRWRATRESDELPPLPSSAAVLSTSSASASGPLPSGSANPL